jgi:FAD/FMN-containing dehydrogenase
MESSDAVVAALSAMRWDGVLRTDTAALTEAADDFGHLVHRPPAAVLRPGSAADVAAALQAGKGFPVVARGMGHCNFGQSQADGGLVLDMSSHALVDSVDENRVTVQAGATWRSVVAATLPRGLVPPVLTDYLGLSVGGTLSVGGIGGTSHRYGLQTDTVLALEVATADGETHTCAPGDDLWDAVLGGQGRHGVITGATIRLVAAPSMVRKHKIRHTNVADLMAAQAALIQDGRFDYVEGQLLPVDGEWQYVLELAAHFDPATPPDDTGLPADRETEDLTYAEFADRLALSEAIFRSTGEWELPHPWWNVFLPERSATGFVDRLVNGHTPDDVGASGLILVYPIFTAPLTTRAVPVPDSPVVYLVGILRTNVPDAVADAIEDNRRWYDEARRAGGVGYQIGTISLTSDDWAAHFGDLWPTWQAWDVRYGVRNPSVVADHGD